MWWELDGEESTAYDHTKKVFSDYALKNPIPRDIIETFTHTDTHTHTQKKTNMMCTKDKELKHENLCVASQPLKIMENSCLCHPQIFTLIPEINSNPVPELDDGSSFRAQKQPPEVFKPMKMPWDFVTTLHTDVPWKLKVVGLMNIFAILSWSVESSVLSVLSSCDVFVILHDGCMVSDGIW